MSDCRERNILGDIRDLGEYKLRSAAVGVCVPALDERAEAGGGVIPLDGQAVYLDAVAVGDVEIFIRAENKGRTLGVYQRVAKPSQLHTALAAEIICAFWNYEP